jgi:hypothetical protein
VLSFWTFDRLIGNFQDMLSKELKQLIKLSGGKVIVSDGNLKSSFVVMKLDEYLKEIEGKKSITGKQEALFEADAKNESEPDRSDQAMQGLTNEELLDRINTDIAQLRNRNVEQEAIENFESENENVKYDYESVH